MFFFSFLILCLHGYKNVCQVHDQTDFLCLSLCWVRRGKNKLIGELQDDLYQSMIWHLCIFSRSFRKIKIINWKLLTVFILPVLVWWNCPLFVPQSNVPQRKGTWFQKLGNDPSFDSCTSNYFATIYHTNGIRSFSSCGHFSLIAFHLGMWGC